MTTEETPKLDTKTLEYILSSTEKMTAKFMDMRHKDMACGSACVGGFIEQLLRQQEA